MLKNVKIGPKVYHKFIIILFLFFKIHSNLVTTKFATVRGVVNLRKGEELFYRESALY